MRREWYSGHRLFIQWSWSPKMPHQKCRLICRVHWFFIVCILTLQPSSKAQSPGPLAIMPLPAHATTEPGAFLIDGKFGIQMKGYTEPRLQLARQRFLDTLSRETGIPLWREAQFNIPSFIVETTGPAAAVQQLGH